MEINHSAYNIKVLFLFVCDCETLLPGVDITDLLLLNETYLTGIICSSEMITDIFNIMN